MNFIHRLIRTLRIPSNAGPNDPQLDFGDASIMPADLIAYYASLSSTITGGIIMQKTAALYEFFVLVQDPGGPHLGIGSAELGVVNELIAVYTAGGDAHLDLASQGSGIVNVVSGGLFTTEPGAGTLFGGPVSTVESIAIDSETWHGFGFQNGWSNAGGGVPCSYRLIAAPYRCIQVVGEMVPGTTANGTTVANLPVGYRPTNRISFPVAMNPSPGGGVVGPLLQLGTSGNFGIFGATPGCTVYFTAIIPLDV